MSERRPLIDASPDALTSRIAEMQQQLDALREQLTEIQRLATIGTIAAVIAHEFNNLLTPIVSYSQYALPVADSEKPDMELIKKALGKAFQSSSKAGKICTSMLGLARGRIDRSATSRCSTLVDEVLLVLARDPQKDGIALRVQVQPDLIVVRRPRPARTGAAEPADQRPPRHARQRRLADGQGAAPTEDDDDVRIQVIDTGPGIPEKLLPKIFQPFFTTKGTASKAKPRGRAWAWRSARRSSSTTTAGSTCSPKSARARRSRSTCPHARSPGRLVAAAKAAPVI